MNTTDADQWEYKTVWYKFQLPDSQLNAMGQEGWELVAFNKASSQIWSSGWTFKRRLSRCEQPTIVKTSTKRFSFMDTGTEIPTQPTETDDAKARKDGWESEEQRRRFRASMKQLSENIRKLAEKLSEGVQR